jgi:hypothetical protein
MTFSAKLSDARRVLLILKGAKIRTMLERFDYFLENTTFLMWGWVKTLD